MKFGKGLRDIRGELGPTLTLALPVIAAELGWMGMGVVDTIIVGRLGAEAIGAVGLGSMAFFAVAVFGMGILLGLDTVVAQAFGGGDLNACHRALVQGVYLAIAMTPPLMALTIGANPVLRAIGVNPSVIREAAPYIQVISLSTLPLLIYAAFRRYLQGMGIVRPVMFALVTANIVNALGNWAFVYGRLGLPAMGVTGSAWATTVSRAYMALYLVVYTLFIARRGKTGLLETSRRPDWPLLKRLVILGLPAALHVTLEVGVFAAATALTARLDASSLAAHQIVLNISSVTFMIPFGLASAGAVRVGHAIGRKDPEAAARAGWTTLALGAAFMLVAALTLCVVPRTILGAFTDDPLVTAIGVSLLFVVAGFQLFDGVQAVATGNLRGTGDTHTAMACNLVAHWGIGLPIGYVLAFPLKMGVLGLWLGLSAGLIAAGTVLLRVWILKTGALNRSATHDQV